MSMCHGTSCWKKNKNISFRYHFVCKNNQIYKSSTTGSWLPRHTSRPTMSNNPASSTTSETQLCVSSGDSACFYDAFVKQILPLIRFPSLSWLFYKCIGISNVFLGANNVKFDPAYGPGGRCRASLC